MADDAKAAPPSPPPQHRDFPVDSTGMGTGYANFARVTGTPEELVIDFGLNTQMTPQPTEPVKLTHRLVINWYSAKRLLGALHMAVQQHENVYGVLETDVQKRVRPGARLGQRPGENVQLHSQLGVADYHPRSHALRSAWERHL